MDKINKILTDFNKEKHNSINAFYKAGTVCIETIASLSNDYNDAIIKTAYDLLERLKRDSEKDDTEYLFQIIIEALLIKEVDDTLTLIHAALQNEYAEDDTKYINLLLFYPKEVVIPIFLEILPLLESWDEDGGESQEIIIDKLTFWNVNIPNEIIIAALTDEAYKVKSAILRYIQRHDLKIYAPQIIDLREEEDDPRILDYIKQLLNSWFI